MALDNGHFKVGHIPWNKGKTHAAARLNPQVFKKGNVPWNKSKIVAVCSLCKKTVPVAQHRLNTWKFCSRPCFNKSKLGKRPWNYGHGMGVDNLSDWRNSLEYKEWRSSVFARDSYTCQSCGKKGVRLHADHELPVSRFPDLRFEVLNGRTLCISCHKQTPTWGGKIVNYDRLMQLDLDDR